MVPVMAVEINGDCTCKCKEASQVRIIMFLGQFEPKIKCSSSRFTSYFWDTSACNSSLLLRQPDIVAAAAVAYSAKAEAKAAAKAAK